MIPKGAALGDEALLGVAKARGLIVVVDLDVASGTLDSEPSLDDELVRVLTNLKFTRAHLVLVSECRREVLDGLRRLVPGALWAAEGGVWRHDDRGWHRVSADDPPEQRTLIGWVRALIHQPMLLLLADERADGEIFNELGDDDIVVATGTRERHESAPRAATGSRVALALLEWVAFLRSGAVLPYRKV